MWIRRPQWIWFRGFLALAFTLIALEGTASAQARRMTEEEFRATLAQLDSADSAVRMAAADQIGLRGSTFRREASDKLRALLRSDSVSTVRASAGRAIGRLGLRDAVPDLIPLCLSSGLGWRVPQAPLVVLAFMGFEWRFLKPTRVGDTIHCVSTTVAKRSMKEGGVVIEERRILNQRGDLVQSGRLTLLVARRPAA